MKKKTRKLIQDIINKEYLTDWEFILERIATQIDEDDFDVEETCKMLQTENTLRELNNYGY